MVADPDTVTLAPTLEEIMGVKLDPREFLIPAKDMQGHSERVWAYLMPGHFMEMQRVTSSKLWPYRTGADVIRHAIHRHLKWLSQLTPFPTVMHQVDAMLEILRDEAFMQDFSDVFGKAGEAIGRHIGQGQMELAMSLLDRLEQAIQDMPEGAWKKKYQGEFGQKFGSYRRGRELGQRRQGPGRG